MPENRRCQLARRMPEPRLERCRDRLQTDRAGRFHPSGERRRGSGHRRAAGGREHLDTESLANGLSWRSRLSARHTHRRDRRARHRCRVPVEISAGRRCRATSSRTAGISGTTRRYSRRVAGDLRLARRLPADRFQRTFSGAVSPDQNACCSLRAARQFARRASR